jgi:hypothetical protein
MPEERDGAAFTAPPGKLDAPPTRNRHPRKTSTLTPERRTDPIYTLNCEEPDWRLAVTVAPGWNHGRGRGATDS